VTRRPFRLAATIAVAGMLALPAATLAADPALTAPPATVVAWQEHLAHMRTMGPNLGAHVGDCIGMHGSMAGQLGPNGMMVQGMGAMMGEGR
jgi:hypothetical protein